MTLDSNDQVHTLLTAHYTLKWFEKENGGGKNGGELLNLLQYPGI